MKYCCDDLKYAIVTGDITHDTEGNKFYAYGVPMLDGTTKCIQMIHCLFCGKRLAPFTKGTPKDNNAMFTTEHKCSNCGYYFDVNVCSKAVTCPECGNWDVENIGASKTEPAQPSE